MSLNFMLFCLFFFFTFVSCSCVSIDSLEGLTKDLALKELAARPAHTGVVYKASLPANLTGMEVSVVRLLSRRLWNRGADNISSCYRIPSRTKTTPQVKRVAFVHQDLGNWSSVYYILPGYSLISSVIGFMVYDASNSNTSSKGRTKLSLDTMGTPIAIRFPNLTIDPVVSSKAKCASFAGNGTVSLTEMRPPGVCYAMEQGHFSIVVQLRRERSMKNYVWVIGSVLGFSVIVLGAYVGILSVRRLKAKTIDGMEKQAEEDLVLETMWVWGSKMPSAAVTRTMPDLEDHFQRHGGSSDHFI